MTRLIKKINRDTNVRNKPDDWRYNLQEDLNWEDDGLIDGALYGTDPSVNEFNKGWQMDPYACDERALAKKSEFFDSFKSSDGKYMEIFKNPTVKEINECKNLSNWKAVRGVINENGMDYCWPASILHDKLKGIIDVDNGIRIAYNNEENLTLQTFKNKTEESLNLIFKFKNIISKYGNINSEISVYDNDLLARTFNGFSELKDFLNKLKNKKVARLEKKSEYYNTVGRFNIEIFKNPTTNEITEIIKEDKYNGVRGVALLDGTIYMWSAYYMHRDVSSEIDIYSGLSFDVEKNSELYIYSEDGIDYDIAKKIISNNINTFRYLEKIGNGKLDVWSINDYHQIENTKITLDKFLEGNENE